MSNHTDTLTAAELTEGVHVWHDGQLRLVLANVPAAIPGRQRITFRDAQLLVVSDKPFAIAFAA